MTETTALAIMAKPINSKDIAVIDLMAETVWKSGRFGVGSAAAAAATMYKGHELGLGKMASFDVIYVPSNGLPVLRPKGALALVRRSGLLEKFDWQGNRAEMTVTMQRKGETERELSLTYAEAKAAGWKSTAWDAVPQNMLRWRLIGWLCDLLFTDVLMGISVADDSWMAVEITPNGDVVDAEWNTVEIISDNNSGNVSPTPAEIIDELITQYGGGNALAMFGAGGKDFRPDKLEHLDMVSRILGEVCSVCGEARGKHQGNQLCGDDSAARE